MSARPVRLAVASRDQTVAQGLRQLLAAHAHRVVVVAPDTDDDTVDVLLHDGRVSDPAGSGGRPQGWVPRSLAVEEIVALIETAAARAEPAPLERLTAREHEVLALIVQGLTNQEIADRVFVSINSVKTYIRSAYRKIGVTSRTQAVVWGLQHGVVPPPSSSSSPAQRRSP